MFTRFTAARLGALIMALAIVSAGSAHAAKSTAAQLGPVLTTGSTISGSTNLGYSLTLTVTSPGTVTALAKIKGKGWKAEFPVLMAPVVPGVMVVNSGAVSVPASFTGTAKLKVKASHDGKKFGKAKILVTVTAPPAAPPVPQTVWYDVGFNTSVVVNADAVSTAGLTPPLTYAWSITDTDIRTNAALAGADTATPTLTTLPITSFPIQLHYETTHLVGIDTDQMNQSTYHLRAIITDSLAQARTGTVTVISAGVSPAQQSIPIGERQYFTRAETNSYSWTLVAKPAGSMAVLENSTSRTPSLRPDLEGQYAISENKDGVTFTVKGATFVGVQTCASCHGLNPLVGLQDRLTPWSQTAHASMAQRGVDGLVSSYYSRSCLACHTVGDNPAPLADNGGFDDVERMTGWQFPSVKQLGNFAAMPAALQNKANIQCESCHGPGSQHPGPVSTSLEVAVCATCHQDGNHHVRVEQWERSPHAEPFFLVSEEEGVNPSCAKCHSTAGFIDYQKGKSPIRAEAGMLSCQACHDPHNVARFPEAAHQLRIYDTVTVDSIDIATGNPLVLTGQGTSATCINCHNARRGPYQPRSGSFYYLGGLPHESTAADVLLGLNAVTNVLVISGGVTNSLAAMPDGLEGSAHVSIAKCTDCHMHESPHDGAGKNRVGDHTFLVHDSESGFSNLAACNKCHEGSDPVSDLDHLSVVSTYLPSGGDYDGDGVTEGVQSEVEGLMANLNAKMVATGLSYSSNYPFWGGFSGDTTTRAFLRAATWNYQMIARDLSHGIHNTAYTVRLLQWTYTVLSTNTGGNSYATDFPNADLR